MDDELSHLPPEGVPVGLGDIADSLGRRRANAMAADRSTGLADVVRAAAATVSSELDVEILTLRAGLADRPPDHRALIAQLSSTLDALTARQRLNDLPGRHDGTAVGVGRRRAVLDEKLLATRTSTEERLRVVTESVVSPLSSRLAPASVIVNASAVDVLRSVFFGRRGNGFQLKNGVRPFIEPVCGSS